VSDLLWDTPPTDEIFENVRSEAIKIWQTYDDEFGYATEKIEKVKGLENIGSNFMYMFQMFDFENMAKLLVRISESSTYAIIDRLKQLEQKN